MFKSHIARQINVQHQQITFIVIILNYTYNLLHKIHNPIHKVLLIQLNIKS